MSTKAREISRVLKNIANDNGKSDNRNLFFVAEVKKVDDETCDVDIAGTTYTGIHLAAVSNGNKNNLIIKPKVGSIVLICDRTGGDMAWMNVVAFSEITNISMKVDEIVINEGKNDGLIKIEQLHNRLKELESIFNGHTHSGVIVAVAGQATGTSGSTSVPSSTSNEFQGNYAGYENSKIKH
jgi:hypothetical protein